MEVNRVELMDFRNYPSAAVELDAGFNLILGRNGQGKTSLLEAVYCLSALGSHRAPTSASMIRHGVDRAVVRAWGSSAGRQLEVHAEIARGAGIKVWVNRQRVGRGARDRSLAAILFSPEDLDLVKGGPEERRRFLDQAAARVRPVTASDRQEFEKAVRQRNGVLKAARTNPRALKQLDVWTEQVAAAGAVVVANRLQALAQLKPAISRRYRELAAAAPPEVTYQASWTDKPPPEDRNTIADLMAARLAETQTRDLEAAGTLSGPHRDDISIELAGSGARLYASQGEQRSLALTLRLAERDVAAEVHGEEPILLLDDVFSELDQYRRDRLGELVSTSGQTIATATSAESLPVRGGRRLVVEEGRLSEIE
ncbi:MAG TPA: DNA replication/repair protein RecF [Actinomycetota bacterium]|nr:DNA replication/repair protein RecF [Actinomycetota bacterium]